MSVFQTRVRQDIRTQRRRVLALAGLLGASTLVYGYGLGRQPLGASEAYSALAAAQPSIREVARNALSFDPGKPVIYHLLLHWLCSYVGLGEGGLRALSLFFGVSSVWLVYALADEMFGFGVGLSAAVLWAFNPLAVVFARWARMYSMLVACALGHLLALAKLQRRPSVKAVLMGGVLGSLMLYTHLAGVLILGTDVIVMVREFLYQRHSVTWPAVAIAAAMFVPFLPIAIAQSDALLFGHWMDWLGTGHGSGLAMALTGAAMMGLLMWLAMGSPAAGARRQAFQRCLIYVAVPFGALGAGSMILRPMFELRYVSPSVAMLAVIVAYGLDRAGGRVRNLATVGAGAFFLTLVPFCYAGRADPWREIAAKISAMDAGREPICFESGFFSPDGSDSEGRGGFPQGFFRVPFDYYFHHSNPRCVVPGSEPQRAQKVIEAQVNAAGGAWLISAKKGPAGEAELPRRPGMRVDYEQRFSRITVFHVRRAS